MTNRLRLIVWTPRVLGALMAVFLAAFALDVFGEGLGVWQTLVALTMHLVPSAVVVIALAIAWRWSAAGGLLFILAGAAYAIVARNHPSWILVISGPLFLVGVLFMLSSRRGTAVPAA